MIRNQRHPQRHPHRNCLVRRYGETRQESPSGRNFVGRTKLVQVCGQFLYRSGGADLVSSPGAHGGLDARLGASLVPPAPMPPFRTIVITSGSDLEPRNGVLRLNSGAVVARLDAGERLMGPVESIAPAQGPCWLPVGYRTPTALVDLDRAVDVGWGPSPVGPTSGAGSPMPHPDEAVRGASAARARRGGRMVRRGTSRPGGSPTVPAPRSAVERRP